MSITPAIASPTDASSIDFSVEFSEPVTGFDDNPLSGADSGKVLAQLAGVGAETYLTVTLPTRNGASFTGVGPMSAIADGLNYAIAGTSDLSAFDRGVAELVPADLADMPALNSGWSYHTFRLATPVNKTAAGFVRLTVEAP